MRSARARIVTSLATLSQVELVARSQYLKAAKRAGVRGVSLLTPSGVRRVAAVAGVDAVVMGSVLGRGRRQRLWIDVYDADGRRRHHHGYRLVRTKFQAHDLRAVIRAVLGLLPKNDSMPASSASADDAPASLAFSGEDPGTRPRPERREDLDGDDPLESSSDAAESVETEQGWPRERRDTAPLDSGVGRDIGSQPPLAGTGDWARAPAPERRSAQGRSGRSGRRYGAFGDQEERRPAYISLRPFGFVATRGYHLMGTFNTVDYQTKGAFPGGGAVLELQPGAGAGPFLEDLGLVVAGAYGVLASAFAGSDGSVQKVSTPTELLSADLRYRVSLAHESRYAPHLGARVGYYLRRFAVSVGNPLFRTVSHRGPRFGVEVLQPLLPPLLELEVWAAAMPASKPGATEAAAYGPAATSTGFWVHAGLIGGLLGDRRGLTWSVFVEALSHTDHFAGTGTLDANARASEDNLVVGAGFGYAY